MTHHIKITTKKFNEVNSGKRKFEIRLNDRNYKIGDIVELQEFLGKEFIPCCPDRHCCEGGKYNEQYDDYIPCPLNRESCLSYYKNKFSGKSIYVKIAIFYFC